MKHRKVRILCAAIAIGSTLSGCASPVPKMTDTEAQNAVFMVQVADTCVQRGFISNVSVAAHNKSLQQLALTNRASQSQISAAISNKANFPSISAQDCRAYELAATQVMAQHAQQQRQVAAQSTINYSAPYQPPANSYPQYQAPEVWSPNRPRNNVISCINTSSILTHCRSQ